MLTLAGMAWFADMDYTGAYDDASVKKCFADATGGLDLDDLGTHIAEQRFGGNIIQDFLNCPGRCRFRIVFSIFCDLIGMICNMFYSFFDRGAYIAPTFSA